MKEKSKTLTKPKRVGTYNYQIYLYAIAHDFSFRFEPRDIRNH